MSETELSVDLKLYSVEALQAAAGAFSARASFAIDGGKVHLRAKKSSDDAEALALEFLNEALSEQYRLFVATMNMPALAPHIERAKKNGFGPAPRDWVKEREPQVAKDREREIQSLLEAARLRGAK